MKGEDDIIEEIIELNEINNVNLMIDADMEIYKSDVQEIKIVAQQNIIDNILKEVTNGKRNIRFKEIVSEHEGIKFIINSPSITGVSLSGPGTINSFDTVETQIQCGSTLIADIRGNCVVSYKGTPEITADIRGNGKLVDANKTDLNKIPSKGTLNFDISESNKSN